MSQPPEQKISFNLGNLYSQIQSTEKIEKINICRKENYTIGNQNYMTIYFSSTPNEWWSNYCPLSPEAIQQPIFHTNTPFPATETAPTLAELAELAPPSLETHEPKPITIEIDSTPAAAQLKQEKSTETTAEPAAEPEAEPVEAEEEPAAEPEAAEEEPEAEPEAEPAEPEEEPEEEPEAEPAEPEAEPEAEPAEPEAEAAEAEAEPTEAEVEPEAEEAEEPEEEPAEEAEEPEEEPAEEPEEEPEAEPAEEPEEEPEAEPAEAEAESAEAEAEAEEEEEADEYQEYLYKNKTYYTLDLENGEMFELNEDGELGEAVGKITNGKGKLFNEPEVKKKIIKTTKK
jgi:hypothetical protein